MALSGLPGSLVRNNAGQRGLVHYQTPGGISDRVVPTEHISLALSYNAETKAKTGQSAQENPISNGFFIFGTDPLPLRINRVDGPPNGFGAAERRQRGICGIVEYGADAE